MTGEWKGFFRVRVGRKRVIFRIDFTHHNAYVAVFDYRGNVYK